MKMKPSLLPFFAFGLLGPLHAGPTASGQQVLSSSRHSFPSTLGSEIIETRKVRDPLTGIVRFLSDSPRVKSARDLVALEDAETLARFRRHGNLAEGLRQRFDTMSDTEKVEVILRPAMPPVSFLDKTKHTQEELKEHSRVLLNRAGKVADAVLLARHGLARKNSAEKKSLRVMAGKRQLAGMRFDPDIEAIDVPAELHPTTSPHFSSLATSAYNPASDMPADALGQGVNASTFESGLTNTTQGWNGTEYIHVPYGNYVGCLGDLNLAHIKTNDPSGGGWEHANQTFQCLRNAAPASNLHHYILYSGGFNDPINRASVIDNGVQTISVSMGPGKLYPGCSGTHANVIMNDGTVDYTANHGDYLAVDQYAYIWPYPVFAFPTANWGDQYEPSWQCYNILNVGNVQHVGQNSYALAPNNDNQTDICVAGGSSSQTRNPKARYGGMNLRAPTTVYSYWSGDREMPYIVAPGITPVTGVSMSDNCLQGPLWSGTSYSAPIANGIAADVISADPGMVSWPEKVRAALLVTAQNVHGTDWNSKVDGRDGAGVISGAGAVAFARSYQYAEINGTALIDGLAASSISSATWVSPQLDYKVKIPGTKPAGKHLRVVLTWDSNPVLSPADNRLSDLDLTFSNGAKTRSSTSYNGNVEIVDVPASEVTAGGTYTAHISKIVDRIPSSQPFFYYCIAWTWVKDHAP